jgi:hypothetical protein
MMSKRSMLGSSTSRFGAFSFSGAATWPERWAWPSTSGKASTLGPWLKADVHADFTSA